MAKPKMFPAVAKAYKKLQAAQHQFQKAVMAAADCDDGVRVSKINACLCDFSKLHPTLTAISLTAAKDTGVDIGTLGGGNTPEDEAP
jgi:hypothetical protein